MLGLIRDTGFEAVFTSAWLPEEVVGAWVNLRFFKLRRICRVVRPAENERFYIVSP